MNIIGMSETNAHQASCMIMIMKNDMCELLALRLWHALNGSIRRKVHLKPISSDRGDLV